MISTRVKHKCTVVHTSRTLIFLLRISFETGLWSVRRLFICPFASLRVCSSYECPNRVKSNLRTLIINRWIKIEPIATEDWAELGGQVIHIFVLKGLERSDLGLVIQALYDNWEGYWIKIRRTLLLTVQMSGFVATLSSSVFGFLKFWLVCFEEDKKMVE